MREKELRRYRKSKTDFLSIPVHSRRICDRETEAVTKNRKKYGRHHDHLRRQRGATLFNAIMLRKARGEPKTGFFRIPTNSSLFLSFFFNVPSCTYENQSRQSNRLVQ